MAKKKKPIPVKQDVVNASAKGSRPQPAKSKPRETAARHKAIPRLDGIAQRVKPVPVVANFQPTPEHPYLIERLLTPEEVAVEYLVRQTELDDQFEKARKALKKWWPSLKKTEDFRRGHITGVSVRYRTRFGRPVSPLQVVIGVNVATKLREEYLNDGEGVLSKLPPSIYGVPVKVVEGCFEFLAPARTASFLAGSTISPKNPLKFTDDLVGGVPIAPPGKPKEFGTLGVVLSATDGSFLGLTCQHVVGNKNKPFDQRGPDTASGQPVTRPIGKVTAAIRKNHTHTKTLTTETIDCAVLGFSQPPAAFPPIVFPPAGRWVQGLSHPAGQSPVGSVVVPMFFSKTRVKAAHSIFDVYKFGSATGGVLIGRIRDVDNLFFSVNGQGFSNNFTVEHRDANQRFVTPGDSGAILALRAEVSGAPAFVAIGILFAAIDTSGSIGLACNMSQILDGLNPDIPAVQQIISWQRPSGH